MRVSTSQCQGACLPSITSTMTRAPMRMRSSLCGTPSRPQIDRLPTGSGDGTRRRPSGAERPWSARPPPSEASKKGELDDFTVRNLADLAATQEKAASAQAGMLRNVAAVSLWEGRWLSRRFWTVVALGISMAIGVIFGFYPARADEPHRRAALRLTIRRLRSLHPDRAAFHQDVVRRVPRCAPREPRRRCLDASSLSP